MRKNLFFALLIELITLVKKTINHDSILNTIQTFYKVRNPRKIFIIGDFNLSSISWPLLENQCSSNPIEKLFVESFTEKGLDQCITEPTHIKGRTLDLLLTNNQSLISNLQVLKKRLYL